MRPNEVSVSFVSNICLSVPLVLSVAQGIDCRSAPYATDETAAQKVESIPIPGTKAFPESITSTTDGTLYVGRVGDGGIVRIEPRTTESTVFVRPGASGSRSILGVFADEEAHDTAVRRMAAAGAQPITWLGPAGELQRDWARTERLGEVAQLFIDHAGASGSVSLWETQLLGAPRNGG